VRAADGIIAGNSFLSTMRRRGHEAASSSTCNVVEPTRYPLPARSLPRKRGTGLGWLSSTLRGLETISPLLERLVTNYPFALEARLDRFLQLQQLPVRACPWSEASETADIGLRISASVGCRMTVEQGKCGLKVLQYMRRVASWSRIRSACKGNGSAWRNGVLGRDF